MCSFMFGMGHGPRIDFWRRGPCQGTYPKNKNSSALAHYFWVEGSNLLTKIKNVELWGPLFVLEGPGSSRGPRFVPRKPDSSCWALIRPVRPWFVEGAVIRPAGPIRPLLGSDLSDRV